VTNREIEAILTKTVVFHRKDWANRLPEVVWAYRTTWKTTTDFTPFELLYGKIAMMPIEFEHKTLRTALDLGMDLSKAQKERIIELNVLDESWKAALHHTEVMQNQRIKWHDKYIKDKKFYPSDWAFLYDSMYQDNAGKLQTRWLGPYDVAGVFSNGAVQLTTIDPVKFKLLVNGHRLRLYHKPTSKEEFLQQFPQHATPKLPAAKGSGPSVPPFG